MDTLKVVTMIVGVGVICGCSAELIAETTPIEKPLQWEEELRYEYRLVQSTDAYLCPHMLALYNRHFREPWNQRPYFREHYPAVIEDWYRYPRKPWNDSTTFAYDKRYYLYPNPAEFAAIKWRPVVIVRDDERHTPGQIAKLDLDNDGQDELVIQVHFYGYSGSDGKFDFTVFAVQQDTTLLDSNPTALQWEDVVAESRNKDYFRGALIRPFLFQQVVYLSEYMPNYNLEFRHGEPERMLVKRYLGGKSSNGLANAEVLCEFDMHQIHD